MQTSAANFLKPGSNAGSLFRFEHTGIIMMVVMMMPYLALFRRFLTTFASDVPLPVIFSARTIKLLGSSLGLSVIVAILAVVAACVVLYFLWKTDSFFFKAAIWFISILLFSLSPLIHLIGWQKIEGFYKLAPIVSVTLILVWNLFPLVLFLLAAGFGSIDKAGIETGLMICSPKNLVRYILIPRILPVTLMASIVAGLFTFSQMEVPSLLGYTVYSEEFLSRIIIEDDIGATVWLSIPYYMAGFAALIIMLFLWRRHLSVTWQRGGGAILKKMARPFKFGSWISAAALICLSIPVLLLFWGVYSINWIDFFSDNYMAVYSSLKLAGLSVFFAVGAAYLIADWLMLLKTEYVIFMLGMFCMLLLLPGSILGLGMQDLSGCTGLLWLRKGNILLILTHAIRILPIGVLLFAGFKWLDNSHKKDELLLLGVSWINRKRYIDLPVEIRRIVIISGIILVIVLSEVSSTILTVSPGTETIILKLYNLLHYGAYETVTALALVQAGVVVILISAVFFISRRFAYDPD